MQAKQPMAFSIHTDDPTLFEFSRKPVLGSHKKFESEKENMCPDRQAICKQGLEADEDEVKRLQAYKMGARGRRGGVRRLQMLPIA
jgi:hypothetical protein